MLFHGQKMVFLISLSFLTLGSGCAAGQAAAPTLQKTQIAYENAGNYWGTLLKRQNRMPATNIANDYKVDVCQRVLKKRVAEGNAEEQTSANNPVNNDLNADFVYNLFSNKKIDYFNVHSELKDSFKRGFRLGYEDRIADLVLGPHLATTAACIGMDTSQDFVNVINEFENGWVNTLLNAIKSFIVLISEGSQADRVDFINQFTAIYGAKYQKTESLKKDGFLTAISAGNKPLYQYEQGICQCGHGYSVSGWVEG